jgi:hypothetical protein
MDIRLRRTRTVRVRGRVTNVPANSPGRAVIFLAQRDSGPYMFDRNMVPVRGGDGKFEVRGVTPGAYHLIAQSFDGQDRQFARVPVDVGTSDVEGIELTLMPSQEVTGTIRVEGEGQVNLASIRLFLEPKQMMPMMGGGMSVTKEDGSFVIRSIVPDTYRIRAMASLNPVYVKSVRLGDQDAIDGEVTIPAGISPVLRVVVSTAGAEVTGIVKGDKDAPVQGATVVLVPDTAKRQRSELFKIGTTDQYGRFTLNAIAPGQYKLFAWDNVEAGEWMDPDFLQPWESKGVSLALKEAARETAELTVLKNQGATAQ